MFTCQFNKYAILQKDHIVMVIFELFGLSFWSCCDGCFRAAGGFFFEAFVTLIFKLFVIVVFEMLGRFFGAVVTVIFKLFVTAVFELLGGLFGAIVTIIFERLKRFFWSCCDSHFRAVGLSFWSCYDGHF